MEPVSDLNTIRNGGYTLRRRRQNYREATYAPRSAEKTLTYRWDDFKPWKNSLSQVEGKCGAAVACYFTFLRRLIILNFILSSVATFFYILPHFTAIDPIPEPMNRTNCEYPIPKPQSSFVNEFRLFFAGQGILESSPLFYGYYMKKETPEHFFTPSIMYLTGTIVIFAVSLIYVSVIAGRSIFTTIVGQKAKKLFKYSKIILNQWDHNISDKNSQKLKRELIAENIRNELQEDNLRYERATWSPWEKSWIYFIRFITTVINMIILIMCIASVGLAATRGKRLPHKGNWFVDLLISYLVSVTLAGTSIIAPIIFRRLILIQKLEPEWMTNQLLCWRVALRFLSLVTLFVALVLDMQICHNSNAIDLDALDVNFTAHEIIQTKILNQSADQVMNDPCENNLCVCWSDVFGQELYKLAVGWLVGQIGTIMGAICFRWIRSCIHSKSTKSKFEFFVAFDLTDNVLKVVSWQTVCWLAVFYVPLMPMIILTIQACVYFLNRLACLNIYVKSEEQRYKLKTEAYFFTVLLKVGYYGALLIQLYVILMPEILPTPKYCGPFRNYEKFTDSMQIWVFELPADVKAIYRFFEAKQFWYSVIMILFGWIYYYGLKTEIMEASIEKLEQQIYMQEEDKRIRALFTQKRSIRSNLELVSRRNQGSQRPSRVNHQENNRSKNHKSHGNRQSRHSPDLQLPVPPPGQQLPLNEWPTSDEYLETQRDQPQGRSCNPEDRSNRVRPNTDESSNLLARKDGTRDSIRLQQHLINESNSRLTEPEPDTRGSPSPTYTPPKGIPTSNQPNRIIRKKFSQISYF